ncbi:MAG: ABC transporter permease [Deltaproteobacteria bacterium]|nr:MAG: ABC transporter permease [Deltaproteobacteria bacterium]
MSRLLSIAWKELVQLRRDRLTIAMMSALPIVQLLLFGYAIDTDVRHLPTVVYDQDHSPSARDFQRRMEASASFDIVGAAASYEEVTRALRSGVAKVALVVPPRFGADLSAGRSSQLQLIVDGSEPLSVSSASSTAAALAAAYGAELLEARLGARGVAPVTVEPLIAFNPELRTAVFIVPGLVGVILTMTMVMLTAMAIARERERGTLEQLIVTPVRRSELVVGKIVPYVLVGYVQASVILAIGRYVFDVPIAGSLPLLYALALPFIGANLALGLFFSTLARTQQQAMQMSMFFLLPNILLSGFMFPWEAMPKPAQWISLALPLTHFLRIVRGITLKGAGLADLGDELLWLVGILCALVVVASLNFRKRVDV